MFIKNIQLIGALTSKPYSFKARSWELENIHTIDLFDSLCSNIRVDVRGSDIMRILPINHRNINDNWISDKARHAFDGIKRKRFINPMIKQNKLFVECSWQNIWQELETLLIFWKNEKPFFYDNLIIKTGPFTDLEHLTSLNSFVKKINNYLPVYINHNENYNADFQSNYLLNYEEIFESKGPQIILLVGCSTKVENPIFNIKLNKLNQQNNILIASIGTLISNNFLHISNNISTLEKILQGKHPFCTVIQNFLKKNLKNKKIKNMFKNNISIIFGSELKESININNYINFFNFFKIKGISFNWNSLELFSGFINLQEIGFFNKFILKKNSKNIYYLLNCEKIKNIKNNDFVIFQGHHNDSIYEKFNIILPTVTWFEKAGLYLNCFGMVQKTTPAILAPVNAKLDWQITYKVNESLNWYSAWFQFTKKTNYYYKGIILNYIYFYNLKKRNFFKNHVYNNSNINLLNLVNIDENLNMLTPNITNSIKKKFNLVKLNIKIDKTNILIGFIQSMPLKLNIHNYYLITSVEKVSKIMLQCSNSLNKKNNNFNKN